MKCIVEIIAMSGNDWVSRGYHQSGSGHPNDKFVISGREKALIMTLDFARRRVELIRKGGNKARILDIEGREILGWDEPLVKDQPVTLQNAHEQLIWRDRFDGRLLEIPLVHNLATGQYFLKLSTSPDPRDSPDVSVSGSSPAEVFERFTTNFAYRPYVDQFVVDDILPPVLAAAAVTDGTPMITVSVGSEIIGIRPGSARS